MLESITIAVQVGLLYIPLVLGIYITMGVLSLPDFTMQGSFGIGGATGAVLAINGANPLVAILVAMIAGALTGLVTAAMHLWLRLNVLLASILVSAAAYSVALVIMGSGNLSLMGKKSVFSWFQSLGLTPQMSTILAGSAITILLSAAILVFLRTQYGVSLIASGQSIQTARGLGIRTESRQVVGLAIGNGLAGVSGALIVQNQGFMDVTIQNGIIVIGLAGMMVGLSLVRTNKTTLVLIGLILGVFIYRLVVVYAIQLGINPNLVQLITAALVVLVVWLRNNGNMLTGLTSKRGRNNLQMSRVKFYEEDRVASFF
ncbi:MULTISPECIES: ABC transporter permease [Micrococcaceae]|uniref:ABC transporter permease n=1 Tax=Micrococcaceae TaxID=1268 RepID=UPI0015BB0DA4|nr:MULTISPECIES: ABC transporter permease [Micrococcaceae]NWL34232.1 ABC transporter permease [Paenarthrobacter nitroguajacolicus]BCW45483.1 ABC transporter permease [Arthrobacter sp. StoSoilB5]